MNKQLPPTSILLRVCIGIALIGFAVFSAICLLLSAWLEILVCLVLGIAITLWGGFASNKAKEKAKDIGKVN